MYISVYPRSQKGHGKVFINRTLLHKKGTFTCALQYRDPTPFVMARFCTKNYTDAWFILLFSLSFHPFSNPSLPFSHQYFPLFFQPSFLGKLCTCIGTAINCLLCKTLIHLCKTLIQCLTSFCLIAKEFDMFACLPGD